MTAKQSKPQSSKLAETAKGVDSEDNKIKNAPYINKNDAQEIKKDMPKARNVGHDT